MAPEPTTRRGVAFVGTGHRAELYVAALLGDHADRAVPLALCDPNPGRIDYHQALWRSAHPGSGLASYGFASVLTGIAANTSAGSGLPVRLDDLAPGILDPAAVPAATEHQR